MYVVHVVVSSKYVVNIYFFISVFLHISSFYLQFAVRSTIFLCFHCIRNRSWQMWQQIRASSSGADIQTGVEEIVARAFPTFWHGRPWAISIFIVHSRSYGDENYTSYSTTKMGRFKPAAATKSLSLLPILTRALALGRFTSISL